MGFLVPVFFIETGLQFDLHALTSSPTALVLLVVFAVLMLLIRGTSGLLSAPRGASAPDRRAIVLLSATGLPIIVAVTDIGVESGDLSAGTASALVGAGMLSVLLFPLLALSRRRSSPAAEHDRDDDRSGPRGELQSLFEIANVLIVRGLTETYGAGQLPHDQLGSAPVDRAGQEALRSAPISPARSARGRAPRT